MSVESEVQALLKATSAYYAVEVASLLGAGRGRPNQSWARQVAMYLIKRKFPALSYAWIGNFFGRDRTTVSHGVHNVMYKIGTKDNMWAERLINHGRY